MDPAVSLNLNTTLGAIQIGLCISYVLFGVTTTQTYIYYSRFPDDSRKLKALVAFVWYVPFMAQGLCAGQALYVYTISDYGCLFGPPPKSLATASFFSGVIGACVQGFFSYRIYVFSKKLFIPSLTWVMAVLRLLSGTAIFYITLRMTSVRFPMRWGWFLAASWSVSAVNDVTITATLATILLCQRTYAQKRTLALMDKLVAWTIETGMLTSAMTIATLICFLAMKESYIWVAVPMVEARMFSNSLLARATLRAMNEVSLPSLHFTAAGYIVYILLLFHLTSRRAARCMDPAISLNLNTTLGASEIGVLFSYVLFGVMTTQTYIYYSRFPDDSRKLKALVTFIWYVPRTAQVLPMQTMSTYLSISLYTGSANYGYPERLLGPASKSHATANFFSSVIGACVQGFFSYRIYAFSKKLFIPSLTWVMGFLRLLIGTAIFYMTLRMTSVHDFETQWGWLLAVPWSISAVNDVTIAATLVTILLCQRTYAQKRTLALIDKLVAWTIETGMLTSVLTVTSLICYFAKKDSYIWVAVSMVEARMFSNSLLARATLRAMNEVSLPSLHFTAAITEVAQMASNVELSRFQSATEMENKASLQQDNYVV
ncbi:hypothetical protein B0H13DRAFT_2368591 [Mycena leptocephala]|nr:hypothetical protein B0H13DRAFT_2368591 [Mycena leptocephala]